MSDAFHQRLKALSERAEAALAPLLAVPDLPEARLYEAMAYSVSAGGKRIRPVLFLAVGELFPNTDMPLEPFACALELIHTYSLIHDDLPAMDNDDLRRGRPTNHKVFGEAMAILAGDGLLNRAYEVMFDALAEVAAHASSEPAPLLDRGIAAARMVAACAGAGGMVGGQAIDMRCETETADLALLRRMHALKTGALIRAAVVAPAILCGATLMERAALETYADRLGLSFQIRDDLLDVTGDEAELGKPIGSDARNGKSTYVSLLGSDGAQKALDQALEDALAALVPFGGRADFLAGMARFVATRTN